MSVLLYIYILICVCVSTVCVRLCNIYYGFTKTKLFINDSLIQLHLGIYCALFPTNIFFHFSPFDLLLNIFHCF